MFNSPPTVDGHIFSFEYPTVLTPDDLFFWVERYHQALDSVISSKIHCLHDTRNVSINDIPTARLADLMLPILTHPNVEWTVLIAEKTNAITQILTTIAASQARIKYKIVPTLEAALDFIQKADTDLTSMDINILHTNRCFVHI